jgi:CRISPR/Cas system-associated exonuclease Cas4 (RecB family)
MAFAYAVRKESQWFKPDGEEPYKLSRTRIDNYIKCRRCFWLEERYGVKKPDSYPLTLNIAVDALLKKEFDIHRDGKTPHPLMESYGIKAVPFQHPKMEEWRANFTGVRFLHEPTNLLIFGAVDDVWVNDKGELHVVDYKATAKADTPTLDGDLGAQYKRQMEVYQWLLRQNGFKVSDTGYFVYVNGRKDAKAFDAKLEFEVTLLPCQGNADWIGPLLLEIKECLMTEEPPEKGERCDYCAYREAAGKTLMKTAPQKKLAAGKKIAKKDEKETQNALF